MRHVRRRSIAGLLGLLLLATTGVRAADDTLAGALKVEQSVRANLLPISPAFVTPKCLVPYPLCKFAYASVALVASWEQLLVGGDLKGAEETLGRGLGGPWLVRPENVTGQGLWSAPAPVPLVGYFATGRSNGGPIPLDPLAAAERPQVESGDILPP